MNEKFREIMRGGLKFYIVLENVLIPIIIDQCCRYHFIILLYVQFIANIGLSTVGPPFCH